MNPKEKTAATQTRAELMLAGAWKPSFCVDGGELRHGGDGVLRRISARGQAGRYIRSAGGGGPPATYAW